jgi:hypothetical protein
MLLPQINQNTHKGMRRTTRLGKIGSKNLTHSDDRAYKIATRIPHTRNTYLETGLKTLMKKSGNQKQIKPDRLYKSNMPESHTITCIHHAH